MKSIESIARAAFAAFSAKLTPAQPVLAWEELHPDTRAAWIAAAQVMANEIREVH